MYVRRAILPDFRDSLGRVADPAQQPQTSAISLPDQHRPNAGLRAPGSRKIPYLAKYVHLLSGTSPPRRSSAGVVSAKEIDAVAVRASRWLADPTVPG